METFLERIIAQSKQLKTGDGLGTEKTGTGNRFSQILKSRVRVCWVLEKVVLGREISGLGIPEPITYLYNQYKV